MMQEYHSTIPWWKLWKLVQNLILISNYFCLTAFWIMQPQLNISTHCTKVRFTNFFSVGFITAIVVNPPKRKLAKRTSVHWGIHVAFLSFRASFSYSLEQKKYNGSWYTLINSSLYTYLIKTNHRLWTPREEIAYTARQKLNPNPKSSGTNEAYFVCHIGPIFQISLIYASIACP